LTLSIELLFFGGGSGLNHGPYIYIMHCPLHILYIVHII